MKPLDVISQLVEGKMLMLMFGCKKNEKQVEILYGFLKMIDYFKG